jgi:hypothetical protein
VNDGGDQGTPDSSLVLDGNIMFQTSRALSLPNAGGLNGLDSWCQQHAGDAGLLGTYVAWFSTSTTNAASRLGTARGWVRADGAPFADTIADIVSGHIFYPPARDEYGSRLQTYLAATGTRSDGTHGSSCNDLTNTAGLVTVGDNTGSTQRWTDTYPDFCESNQAIYCFGIDRQVPLVITPPSPARLAFVTAAQWTSGGGLASADALCQTEASASSLPNGTYLAALATTSATAQSRMAAGAPWVRVDGIPFMNDAWFPSAPLNVTASRAYITGVVLVGAPNSASLADANCNNYASAASGQSTTIATMELTSFQYGGSQPCNLSGHLYCFQQ